MSVVERPSASTEKWPRARKERECVECKMPIKRGEKYQYITGVWSGGPGSISTCAACVREIYFLTTMFEKEGIDFNPEVGRLYDDTAADELPDHCRGYWIEKGWAK